MATEPLSGAAGLRTICHVSGAVFNAPHASAPGTLRRAPGSGYRGQTRSPRQETAVGESGKHSQGHGGWNAKLRPSAVSPLDRSSAAWSTRSAQARWVRPLPDPARLRLAVQASGPEALRCSVQLSNEECLCRKRFLCRLRWGCVLRGDRPLCGRNRWQACSGDSFCEQLTPSWLQLLREQVSLGRRNFPNSW